MRPRLYKYNPPPMTRQCIRIIKGERENSGMTQREIAKAIGITQAHYSKIERGMVPIRLDDLDRLSRKLDFDLVELLRIAHTLTRAESYK